ncbi:MAG TPA: methylmalonyl Co-A mutase-associated GTPase MeaB [Acidimicrobiia bacterium]|nr:methylmalonyl Co-A mutase-associated GTPase MeaB [Acidimicrobiia bacterium]
MAAVPSITDLVEGVRSADRASLGRAITLIESSLPDHRASAQELLSQLLANPGSAHRVGITGVPGVGKSTFIETLGETLTSKGHRVAVLAVDPTSTRTGGSILGDKTRMSSLANDDAAFVRPSPTAGELGGVTRMTRETILLCEAAGFDVVLVETVGVGQSETAVADMVDFFLVLMLPGAGDELQGIKKGILELADMIAVNKADGNNGQRAAAAAREYQIALHLTAPASPHWTPPVLTCAGLTGEGVETLWSHVEQHRRLLSESGDLERRREEQRVRWMWSMLDDRLLEALRTHPEVGKLLPELESQVRSDVTTPVSAVNTLIEAFLQD